MTFGGGFGRVFRPVFDPGLAARNGLLNALVAYWPCNEASGGMLDLHTGGKTLPGNSGNAAGKVYSTAREFNYWNRHQRNDSDLYISDLDFTVAGWAYPWVVSQGPAIAGRCEYQPIEYTLRHDSSWMMQVYNGSYVITATGSEILLNTWQFVVGWHDCSANTVNVQINNGVVYSAAIAQAASSPAAGLFEVGHQPEGNNWFAGRIGPVAFWKSAAGAGGVLSAAQRTALYNGGAGLAYANFTT